MTSPRETPGPLVVSLVVPGLTAAAWVAQQRPGSDAADRHPLHRTERQQRRVD